ncbi:hypothetical protein CFOL_v3_16903, partial [Cephalotus follicularis]
LGFFSALVSSYFSLVCHFNTGVILGASHIVTPSACHEIEAASNEVDQQELNAQIFLGVCSALQSLDQGLICASNCNVETMKMAAFHCYYILQPSDQGPMLLRRLAGSEEVMPIPEVNGFIDYSVPENIENSIQASLLKMESKDYDPVLHKRGFHQKLNLLVKESLQFGFVPPKLSETTSEPSSVLPVASEVIVESNSATDIVASGVETPLLDLTAGDDKSSNCITEEWEQLIVSEAPKRYSPNCISKSKLDQSVLSSPDSNRQLDVRTSSILERLELPKQLKAMVFSPTTTSSGICNANLATKKPLIPFQPIHASDQPLSSSQLMKPNFQRLKRKHN